ncbi:hypothetical protein HGRIS_013339 [Hohenbuehelia grisea]|uniref:Conserved oligomeric Golgi complex subunit 4 n=1 Tax=Hohenbuehelia grisea TaxID=104357 RepID=A0ABR3IVC2_9AGAR
MPEVLSCLSAYQSDESELSNALANLLSAREPIVNALTRLHTLTPQLDILESDASLLSKKVSQTAQTAERVGGRVRTLDEEMKRIREAGDRVSQVMDLKASLGALQASIEAQDWESATRHCARAMSLPSEVIGGPFAESAVPTSESHLPPAQTLQDARERLLVVFRRQFELASKSRDSTATSRFFKLFPAIGWEAEGLEAYASFVVELVRVRAPTSAKTSSPLYFITALTALYESIAMIIDQHQPVVAKYYGPGKMISVVQRLLDECDRVTKSLFESWEEERSIQRRLSEISAQNPGAPASRKSAHAVVVEKDTPDPREIDKLLTEMAGMTGRWNLFGKFLSKSLDDENLSGSDSEPAAVSQQLNRRETEHPPVAESKIYIQASASNRLFENLISMYYTPFEVWYMRTIVEKAIRLSIADSTQGPASTTTPDDVFYVLKLVLARLLSTGSIPTVERSIDQLRVVMESDYAGGIKKKLDDVYRSSTSGSAVRGERAETENRVSFITHLNDLDISSSHVERLTQDLINSSSSNQYFSEDELPALKTALTSMAGVAAKFNSILRLGVEQLFNQLMRPKLRTFLTDIYKEVSYVLDDDSYAAAEYQDVVRKKFIKSWENCMEVYRETFTEHNYRIIFGLVLDVLLRPWEKLVTNMQYSELGAIRFDRDLRSIIAYLASQTAFGDAREKFTRLQQISTLLNLDSEEDVEEFYNGSGITWKLTTQEAKAIAGLKI